MKLNERFQMTQSTINKSVKLADFGVSVQSEASKVHLNLVVNEKYVTAYCEYNWVIDLFTINTVDYYSLSQFCDIYELNISDFGERIYKLFKRNYKR